MSGAFTRRRLGRRPADLTIGDEEIVVGEGLVGAHTPHAFKGAGDDTLRPTVELMGNH